MAVEIVYIGHRGIMVTTEICGETILLYNKPCSCMDLMKLIKRLTKIVPNEKDTNKVMSSILKVPAFLRNDIHMYNS